jgi:hypothetical protein
LASRSKLSRKMTPDTADATRRFDSQNWILLAVIVTLACALLVATLRTSDRPPSSTSWASPEFSSCEKQVLTDVHPDKNTLLLLENISTFCFTKLQEESYLSVFDVNRGKYVEQSYEDNILLWMVVAITISGVILAGLQLMASYRLASVGKAEFVNNSDLNLAKDRLSLKSSVTGVIILLISLAFFFVYVKYVYKIEDANSNPAASTSISAEPIKSQTQSPPPTTKQPTVAPTQPLADTPPLTSPASPAPTPSR